MSHDDLPPCLTLRFLEEHVTVAHGGTHGCSIRNQQVYGSSPRASFHLRPCLTRASSLSGDSSDTVSLAFSTVGCPGGSGCPATVRSTGPSCRQGEGVHSDNGVARANSRGRYDSRRAVIEAGGRCEAQRRISSGLEFRPTTPARLLGGAYPATREGREVWRTWHASRRWAGRPRSRCEPREGSDWIAASASADAVCARMGCAVFRSLDATPTPRCVPSVQPIVVDRDSAHAGPLAAVRRPTRAATSRAWRTRARRSPSGALCRRSCPNQ